MAGYQLHVRRGTGGIGNPAELDTYAYGQVSAARANHDVSPWAPGTEYEVIQLPFPDSLLSIFAARNTTITFPNRRSVHWVFLRVSPPRDARAEHESCADESCTSLLCDAGDAGGSRQSRAAVQRRGAR